MADNPVGHQIVETDTVSTLTGPSTRLTCACGWHGHSTGWGSPQHAAHLPGIEVPPLPALAPRPPVPRDVLRAAIYGERRRWR